MNFPDQKVEIFDSDIECIDSSLPIWKIWKLMKAKGRKFLPMLKNGNFEGVVRSRDILSLATTSQSHIQIEDAVDRDPFCVKLTDNLQTVKDRFTASTVEYVVLLNQLNEPIEIVTVNQMLLFVGQNPNLPANSLVLTLYKWRINYGNH